MITKIFGRLIADMGGLVEITPASGVTYEVRVPLPPGEMLFYNHADQGQPVEILIYHHRTEALEALYGFRHPDDRELFKLLIGKVSGVGPSVGMAILAGMPSEVFKNAVATGDVISIKKIKGVGDKTAARIVLELGDKVGVVETWKAKKAGTINPAAADAEMALITLGWKQKDARTAVERASAAMVGETTTEKLIRLALQKAQ